MGRVGLLMAFEMRLQMNSMQPRNTKAVKILDKKPESFIVNSLILGDYCWIKIKIDL